MIHKIYANNTSFKQVEFKMGLNIILAIREEKSHKKDTRNGVGKTTLISIIHFCLGADLKKLKLPVNELQDWVFSIELDLHGERITASRSINNSKVVQLHGNIHKFSTTKISDEKITSITYTNAEWKKLLGECLFKINKDRNVNATYSPSFRGLISYFIRFGYDAYSDPFRYFRTQKPYDLQINNAFLLGLNWVYASELQEIRDKESAAKAINNAIKTGIALSQGELEAERVRLEKEVSHGKDALSNFKVYPQYKELAEKANQLTNIIHEFSNKIITLRGKLQRYEESIVCERVPSSLIVEQLYSQAGMYFPDAIKSTLKEAKIFHEAIVKNRREFLNVELTEIKNQIFSMEAAVKLKIEERSELMLTLKTHGALEEFTLLQEKLLEKKAQLEALKTKISDIKNIHILKKQNKASKIELETKLQRDYEQCRSYWEKSIELFNENSLALYNEPGDLIINTSENGYQFGVEIQRSNSEGISKMKIFCYDLMLVEVLSKQRRIDFLIHDSTIFDGVDSRQRALALEHVNKKSISENFQYICILNSDMIPYNDFSSGFDINKFIRLKLTDCSPSDALLGFKFEIKKIK